MRAEILAWSVPGVFLAFGLCFALLSHLHHSLKWWSGSFTVAALGFAMTVVPTAPHAVVKPTVEDTMFLLALSGVNIAFAARAGRRPRIATLCTLVALGSAGAAISLAVFDSAPYEICAVQSACAAIMFLSAYEMRRDRGNLDPVLFWLCIAIAASLALQNVLFMADPPAELTVATWRDTAWGFVFQLSGAATGILLAICVILATTLDIIERLRAVSNVDALTGVLNRRGLEQRVQEMRARARPLALIVTDLDHFKTINDRFGHEAGDAVLCGFTALAERMVGRAGCVARLGGEEFAMVMEAGDPSDARRLAEAMRLAIRDVAWPGPLAGVEITASFGVASFRPEETLFQAINRADDRLYRAKSVGRNAVVADGDGLRGAQDRRPAAAAAAMADAV